MSLLIPMTLLAPLSRVSSMCAADMTPFVWARDPRDGRLHGLTTVSHACRDWNALERWAAARPIVTGFNVTKPIAQDPLGWAGFQYGLDYGEITDWAGQRADYEAWAQGKIHEQHLRGHVGYMDKTNYF